MASGMAVVLVTARDDESNLLYSFVRSRKQAQWISFSSNGGRCGSGLQRACSAALDVMKRSAAGALDTSESFAVYGCLSWLCDGLALAACFTLTVHTCRKGSRTLWFSILCTT